MAAARVCFVGMTHTHISRRTMIAIAAAAAAAPIASATSLPIDEQAKQALADLERKAGGRLGAYFLRTADGRSVGNRQAERFAMCSTFKMPLAAAILRETDRGKISLDKVVPYTKADLVAHGPVTEANLAKGGMAIRDLAEAAQTQSDGDAANLLLKQLGGPQGFTAFFRELGDDVTRLDRYEPEMNRVAPGDERDTTSPAAIAATTAKILTGDALAPASRELLIEWMIATKTGSKRIRAGLPPAWRAGDKTGTMWGGDSGDKYNDIAVVWPPNRAPVIITAYYNPAGPAADEILDKHQAVLAEVGRIAAAWIGA
jgi:beta-lactamase class A